MKKALYWIIGIVVVIVLISIKVSHDKEEKERKREAELERLENSFRNTLDIDETLENNRKLLREGTTANEIYDFEVPVLNQ